MVSIVGAIRESPLRVRRNKEVEAQSRSERDRWTFYKTINFYQGILEKAEKIFSFLIFLPSRRR